MLIVIDHGNKQIKTVRCPPFVSGLVESVQKPFGKDVLAYGDKFYTLSGQRIPYRRDKTEDERFFVLTLFAVTRGLLAAKTSADGLAAVNFAVGLPPAHYGAQNQAFTEYFSRRGVLRFGYHDRAFSVCINDVRCYPQAYGAAALLRRQIEESGKVETARFIEDVRANAKGYEFLYQMETAGR